MAKAISKDAVEIISNLNQKLFDAEDEMMNCKCKVSAQRYYLAAEPNADNVHDLMVFERQLNDCEERVESLRKSLKKALQQAYTL